MQIGVYMTLQPYTNFKNLKDVWYEKTEKGTFIYFSGRFKSSEKATEHRINLVNIGYTNAFIVSLLKNNRNWK